MHKLADRQERWQYEAAMVLLARVLGLGVWYAALVYTNRVGGAQAGATLAAISAWSAILAVPMHRGWPQLALRIGAERPGDVDREWWQSTARVARLWLPVGICGLALIPLGPAPALVAAGAACVALLRIDEGWLRATGNALRAIAGLSIVSPCLTLVGLLLVSATSTLTPWRVAMIAVTAWVTVLVMQRVTVGPRRPRDPDLSMSADRSRQLWTIAVSTATGVASRNADLAVAAVVLTPEDVASYALVSRLAQGLLQISVATNAVLAPELARRWHDNQRQLAHERLTEAARYGGLAAVAASLAIAAALPIVFELSDLPLRSEHLTVAAVLVVGNLLVVGVGPAMLALNITGGEIRTAKVQLFSLAGLAICISIAALSRSMIALSVVAAGWTAFSHMRHRLEWNRRVAESTP